MILIISKNVDDNVVCFICFIYDRAYFSQHVID